MALIEHDPVPLLQTLLRLDTTNPPGEVAAAVAWARDLLAGAGLTPRVLALDERRPNLVARLPGRGLAPPLLLYGHLDVVTVADQAWSRDPFGGEIADGSVWGRGTLDMKAGDAMFLSALLRARAENVSPPGDIILALVCDEETGGDYGSRFLVEQHPELFQGVHFALGEFGGFTYHLAGRKFYPIMVAEKQICHLRAVLRGPAGHSSLSQRDGTMARLADFLRVLNRERLPVHITPALTLMIDSLSGALPARLGIPLQGILSPVLADPLLARLGQIGEIFAPLIRNTATPTMVRGGEQINVLPCEIQVGLDGRLLPGFTPQQFLAELQELVGSDVEFIVERHDPGPEQLDMDLFPMLERILRQGDPHGYPVPLFLPAVTDARFFSRLGIQTYGFIPMNLPAEFKFTQLVHAADERIPVEALRFGADTIYRTILEYGL